jgi:hypothetical protein
MEAENLWCPPPRKKQFRHLCLLVKKGSKFQCQQPNVWKAFAAAHAGHGYTRTQLKAAYNRMQKQGKITPERACEWVRDLLLNESRNLMLLSNPCLHWTSTPETRPDTWRIRRAIVKHLLSAPKDLRFNTSYVTANELTPKRIMYIVKLIDRYYFDNSFLKRLHAAGVHLVAVDTAKLGRKIKDDDFAWVEWVGPRSTNSIALYLNPKAFVVSRRVQSLNFYGLLLDTPLHALIATIEHELAHVLIMVFCPKREDSPHGKVFKKLTQQLFGHSEQARIQ